MAELPLATREVLPAFLALSSRLWPVRKEATSGGWKGGWVLTGQVEGSVPTQEQQKQQKPVAAHVHADGWSWGC